MIGFALTADEISEIRQLRANGLSLKQIAKTTTRSKATISKFIRGLRENNPRNTNAVMGGVTLRALKRSECDLIIAEALAEWNTTRLDPALVSLIMAYWGEGSKRTKAMRLQFSICNSDPGFIATVLSSVQKLGFEYYASLTIYEGQDEDACRLGWLTVIPALNIRHVYVRKPRSKHRLYSKFGVCRIVSSSILFLKIMTWIRQFSEEFGITDNFQL